ncbi:MAG TPA: heparan-alpha-glucosaminide N-acetyltransferase domain-containing protein [Cyclobacteriaceae bacterium]|nr:heparan-alpha-glucosaminide N-acetyltransferase domain-containing protein [Cyclobacteriaceae bacterium]
MAPQEYPGSTRVQSVDILRGVIVVLMAADHVRVYSGLPAGGPEPSIFFTRWITHFCAPGFVFLAGTGAFFYGKKLGNTRTLARFLLSRGLLLVFLELTLIRFGWTFNFNYGEFVLAGVIWMLGWCMVILSFLVAMRPVTVGITGLAIVFFQQLFALVPKAMPESLKPSLGGFWEFIYSSGLAPWPWISVLYVLVPWIGVMAAGYGFGTILSTDADTRRKLCLRIGITATLLFIVIGSTLILFRPNPAGPPFIFRLLAQQKYPASQLFLLMTLGPMIALIPSAEKAKGRVASILTTFGRVPFFYYLLHIPLIHASALIVNYIRDGSLHQEWYTSAPFSFVPQESRWTLSLLYLVFIIDVAILYAACRWYVSYKFSHPSNKILKYI